MNVEIVGTTTKIIEVGPDTAPVKTVAGKRGEVTLEIEDILGLEDALENSGSSDAESIRGHAVNEDAPVKNSTFVWDPNGNSYTQRVLGAWPVPDVQSIEAFDQNAIHRFVVNGWDESSPAGYTTQHGVHITSTMDAAAVAAAWNAVVSAPGETWLQILNWNGWTDYETEYIGPYVNSPIGVPSISITNAISGVDAFSVQSGTTKDGPLNDVETSNRFYVDPTNSMITVSCAEDANVSLTELVTTKMLFITNSGENDLHLAWNDEDSFVLPVGQTRLYVKPTGTWIDTTPVVTTDWSHPGEIGVASANGGVFTNLIASGLYTGTLNLSGLMTASGTIRAQGPVDENLQGIARMDFGVQAGTPRSIFENSGKIWATDLDTTGFRMYGPPYLHTICSFPTTAIASTVWYNNNQPGVTINAGSGIEISAVGQGIVLKSPNGTRYRVVVTDGGSLSVAAA